ncbi:MULTISPECIES: anthranilate synthase component II [Achromobacter]|uniref:Aminodeoxychorismate/anthranilate synthase component II n=1 Tax=Achromobacter spanius TaxID=217203 RepID=A0ABY8GM83_9BURK|nr:MULTISPECIES: aminodeoxychorismate/anthranilate synthase component II [Achromobacter]WAI84922.1 aminodeoxychorismate/anthranilate synthase component II [Achromobacter spanius]WEX95005.1 aminodeoxychorismate/anthranilate synthase component II [Achromobacter sp. SS2-2022]WFP05826.1 aminodeoxychorismate/anthranilate synthase component II [Achromobacter spanius]
MNVLLVDAYDSFVYLIDHHLRSLGLLTRVIRCDDPALNEALLYSPAFVVLGPGPGRPEKARYPELVRAAAGRVPILGVCLGHQGIAQAYGCNIVQAVTCMHGKTSSIVHDNQGVFGELTDTPFLATRYHSLVVDPRSVPPSLQVSAHAADDGHIMGLRHKSLPVEGVQFHPESICTQHGASIFTGFIRRHVKTI